MASHSADGSSSWLLSLSKLALATWSTTAVFVVLLPSLLAISIATTIVYRRYFHPLSGIPGPFFASFTSLWLVLHDRTLKRHVLDMALHKKYGPIVRVSYDNVMLSSVAASKVIYSPNGDYNKSDYYMALGPDQQTEERMSLLSETNMPRFRMIKRVTGPVLTLAAVKKYERLCDPVLERYVEKMTQEQGNALDLLKWMHIVSTELLESMVFSDSDDIISSGDDAGDTQLTHEDMAAKNWIVCAERSEHGKPEVFQETFSRRIKERTTSLEYQKTSDFFTDVIKLHDTRPDFRTSWIPLMAYLVLNAGFDTMGSTLTALIIQVARNPRVKEKIQQELLAAKQAGKLTSPIPTYDECAALPYLTATAVESMRLHASIGFVLERVVPDGGVTFEGRFLPAGTKVGCNPRVIHRDKGIYGADADVFNPDRYLNASAEQKREMEAVSLRWGGGIRKCPGDKMAMVAMAKFMTVFFGEFDVELLEEPELKKLGLDGQEEEISFATTKWKGAWMKLTKLS
ncbi:uncharacterized protein PAC_16274 [Phialocephala subalpina]|uniref:Cytochrome P450 n=1 Tax=Phialocephala subalpina TaxID=576137 RepID=A0A1L7XMW7_9HELO|nr:uncharacterized protein PAC_16274 [Phialocephala subalpina]